MARRPRRPSGKSAPKTNPALVRLQKVLAEAGVGSRRACEQMIEKGLVRVNGERRATMPVLVDPATDHIEVEGEPLASLIAARRRAGAGGKATRGEKTGGIRGVTAGRKIFVMLYKPRQTLATLSDDAGRQTVADIVRHPSGLRLYPVGRLDYDTMGLLLLTNDGELANRLTHPRYGVQKRYRAVVKGALSEEEVRIIERAALQAQRRAAKPSGRAHTNAPAPPSAEPGSVLTIVSREPSRTTLDITLNEGRNLQVRLFLQKAGCPVKKLLRTQLGPLKLKGVALGQWRELTLAEVQSLRRAAGMPISRRAESAGGSASLRSKGRASQPEPRQSPKAKPAQASRSASKGRRP